MKQYPLVQIVVINFNGLNDTVECLESLSNINYKNYQILVVDNGSQYHELAIIKKKFPFLKYKENKKNIGFTGASNQGMRYGLSQKADYVLLLNNDTIVTKDFLDILVNYGETHKKVGILSPKILYHNTDCVWSMGGYISSFTGIIKMIGKNTKTSLWINKTYPMFITGCSMLIKSKIIKQIGLMNEKYFAYFEDVDYSFRARKQQYGLIVIPESIIYHKKKLKLYKFKYNAIQPFQAYLQGRNSIIFAKTYFKRIRLIWFIISHTFFKVLFITLTGSSFISLKSFFYGLKDGFVGKLHID